MVRPALPSDLEAITDALPALVAGLAAQGNDQWSAAYPTPDDFARDLASGALWVDAVGGQVAAFAALDTHEPPEYAALTWEGTGPVLVVHRLAVLPAFRGRGRGLAHGLVAQAETLARSRGLGGLRADTAVVNPAMNRLFASRGWRPRGEFHFPDASVAFRAWELTYST